MIDVVGLHYNRSSPPLYSVCGLLCLRMTIAQRRWNQQLATGQTRPNSSLNASSSPGTEKHSFPSAAGLEPVLAVGLPKVRFLPLPVFLSEVRTDGRSICFSLNSRVCMRTRKPHPPLRGEAYP